MSVDPAAAVWKQCCEGVADVIRGLALAGTPESPVALDPANVFSFVAPTEMNVTFPGVLVFWAGQTERIDEIAFEVKARAYPINVQIVDRNDSGYQAPAAKYLRWRDQVATIFDRQIIQSVPAVYDTEVVPGVVGGFSAGAGNANPYLYVYQALVVRCLTYEPR